MSTSRSTKSHTNTRTTVEKSVYGESTFSDASRFSNKMADIKSQQPYKSNLERFAYTNPQYRPQTENESVGATPSEWEKTLRKVYPLVEANREAAKKSLYEYGQRYYKNQRRSTRKNRKNRKATRRSRK